MHRGFLVVLILVAVAGESFAFSSPVYDVRVVGTNTGNSAVLTDGFRQRVFDSYGKGAGIQATVQVISADAGLAPITFSYGRKLGVVAEQIAPLFGGNAVADNDSTTIVLNGVGEQLNFIANAGSTTVRSDNTARVVILSAGQNLEQVAASKGLLSSGSARGLTSLVSTFVDTDDCNTTVNLLDREALFFYELDSTNPADAEYDFQDLVVYVNFGSKVTASGNHFAPPGSGDDYICGQTSQPYVRDSIGPDSSATDNTDGLINMILSPSTYFFSAFEVPSGSGGQLGQLELVAGESFGSCNGRICYEDMSYTLVGWNSATEASASPLSGTLFSIDVTNALSVVENFGVSDDGGFFPPGFITNLLRFDLSGFGVACPITGCVFGLLVDPNTSTDLFEIRISTLSGPSDIQFYDGAPAGGASGGPTMAARFTVE